jgi:hypothetical protein
MFKGGAIEKSMGSGGDEVDVEEKYFIPRVVYWTMGKENDYEYHRNATQEWCLGDHRPLKELSTLHTKVCVLGKRIVTPGLTSLA